MAQDIIVCSPKYLPVDLHEEASRNAIVQNPANAAALEAMLISGLILAPEHLALMTQKYWGAKGVSLTVGFLETIADDLAARLLLHFNAWGEFANVKFVRTKTSPQVRVTRSGDGYWSYIGTDILSIPSNEPTMCLQDFTMNTPDSEFHRVVRHEVGHTLGFPHEHMRRQLVSLIDPNKAIPYFQRTQGWSAAVTRQQVLMPLDESSIRGTPDADQESIMCYSLPGSITFSGLPIIGGVDFTAEDKDFAAKQYPKEVVTPPTPPSPPVTPPPVNPGTGSSVEVSLSLDIGSKKATLSMPSGWSVSKKANQESGPMHHHLAKLQHLALELESALPKGNDLQVAVAAAQGGSAASLGGLFLKVTTLLTDLKAISTSTDYTAAVKKIMADIRDVLNEILQDQNVSTSTDGSIQFALGGGLGGILGKVDLSKVLGIITQLLPLILGIVGK